MNSEFISENNGEFHPRHETRINTGGSSQAQGINRGCPGNFVRREFLDSLVLHLPAIDDRINISQRLTMLS